MALLTCNDIAVLSGTIRMPRVGMWSADLMVDTRKLISGPVTLSTGDGSFTLKGTILPGRSGLLVSALSAQIYGGAGGLTQEIPPKFYQGVTAGLVIGEVLSDCGETLSSTSDADVLATPLKTWTRTRGAACRALYNVLDALPGSWRCLPDGTIWVGTDTYPAVTDKTLVIVDEVFSDSRATIKTDSISLFPGTTLTYPPLGPQKISSLVHKLSASSYECEAYFEP